MSAGVIATAATVVVGGLAVLLAEEQEVVVTPSASDPSGAAEVWAVGDADPPAAGRVAELIGRATPDRIVYLGDVYPDGTAADFERWGKPWEAEGLLELMAPTPGNHDWKQAEEGYYPFWEDVRGERPRSVYSFTAGGWKIIAANTEERRWRRVRDRLRAEARGGGTCRIAFWHRPRFTAGHHEGGNRHAEAFWKAVRRRARIILAGHDHNMQRFKQRNGIVQFISGAGGRKLYPVNGRDRRLAFSNDKRYGALRLDLSPGRAAWSFVAVGGRVLDRGTLRCNDP